MGSSPRVLELFAGVGCFGLGLEAAGYPASTWHCEWDPFARSVLARHWPGTPCFPDVREVGDVGADVIVGGPPCQSISVAGKQLGPDDPRFLWPATMDVVRANHPKWCLFENPGALLTHDGGQTFLVHIARPLAEMGYLVRWDHCPASAVGAPHRRDRVWITAVLGGVAPGPADAVNARLVGAAVEMPSEWPRAGWYDGRRWGAEGARWPVSRGVLEGVDTGQAWPTPDANAINDGNDPVRWQERRDKCRETKANGNGFGVPLAMAARLAGEPGGSSTWPTPKSSDANGTREYDGKRGLGLNDYAERASWPIPSAQDDDRGTDGARLGGSSLTGAVASATGPYSAWDAWFSTHAARGGSWCEYARLCGRPEDAYHPDGSPRLIAPVPIPGWARSDGRTWATPSARDGRDPQASQATLNRNARPLNEQAWDVSGKGKGKLNPDFAEWLLGMPLGWTSPDGNPLPRALPDWSGDLTYYGGRPAPAGMPLLVPHYKGRRERLRCVGNACLPRVVATVANALIPSC